MINILLPISGKNSFFHESDYPYPKSLIEINGETMIERVLKNLKSISKQINFIFIVSAEDCKKYHFDNTLQLLTDGKAEIIIVDGVTKGAACSALLAIEKIQNDIPLIICNADQIFNCDLKEIINDFEKYDAGTIAFESVHPRWAYAKLDDRECLTQISEKNPISKNAVAGFYYFSKGSEFVDGAFDMISKSASVNDVYYISPVLNELVLKGRNVKVVKIDSQMYSSFYSPERIRHYERGCVAERNGLE
jgi:NDP-sugar pyrophosphorylase family protein